MIKRMNKGERKNFNDTGLYLNLYKLEKDFNFLNFFMGGRGIGKTFNILRYLINDFIENENQFMLVRRTNAQLNPVTLFSSIIDFFDGDFTFQTIDKQLTEIYYNKKLMCYLSAVSTAYNLKSQSFPKVKTIFYDEFLPTLNERPIKNEVFLFLELCESVFRLRNDTQIFMSANTVNLDNQYFNYFKILLDDIKDDTIIRLDNISIFKLTTSNEYLQEKTNSKFGQLVYSTQFFDYAYKNNWLIGKANQNFIDSSIVKHCDRKNDFCLYFGGDIYYKISYLNKYSCTTYIYADIKKSSNTVTPYTAFINKKINFITFTDYIQLLHNFENDLKNKTLKFDSTKTYNKFINVITPQMRI